MEGALDGWTRREKLMVLRYLKALDFDKMEKQIPTRNRMQIKDAVLYMVTALADAPPSNRVNVAELQHFVISNHKDLPPSHSPAPYVVRLANDVNDVPPDERTWNIDVRELFHQMANAIEGKPVVADAAILEVLQILVEDVVDLCGGYISPALREFMTRIDSSDIFMPQFFASKQHQGSDLGSMKTKPIYTAANSVYQPDYIPAKKNGNTLNTSTKMSITPIFAPMSINCPPMYASVSANNPLMYAPASVGHPPMYVPPTANNPPMYAPVSINCPPMFAAANANNQPIYAPANHIMPSMFAPRSPNNPPIFTPVNKNYPPMYAPASATITSMYGPAPNNISSTYGPTGNNIAPMYGPATNNNPPMYPPATRQYETINAPAQYNYNPANASVMSSFVPGCKPTYVDTQRNFAPSNVSAGPSRLEPTSQNAGNGALRAGPKRQ